MTETEENYDEVEDFEQWPTLAISPLYVLRTAVRCPQCRKAMHVYTLGCAGFRHADDSRPVGEFHFLRMISSVPEDVLTLLRARCPSYFLDREEESGEPYLMNHCQCGAKLDDDFLHGDVGAAFWPDTPDGYGHFKLFRLPIDGAIPIESSSMLGGDEYLDFDQAEVW
jgi:hypothetical protein